MIGAIARNLGRVVGVLTGLGGAPLLVGALAAVVVGAGVVL